MKTMIIPTQKNVCAFFALLLAMMVLMSAAAQAMNNDSIKRVYPVKLSQQLDQTTLKELSELAKKYEAAVQPASLYTKTYRVVDTAGKLVYEAEQQHELFAIDQKLRCLLHKSDFLVEYGNVRYYMLASQVSESKDDN